MFFWFPEPIRYERRVGTAEIVCPGCRERVVADLHEKLKSAGKVGRCRLCGFFAALPDEIPLTKAQGEQSLATDSHPPQVSQFVAIAGSAYEVARAGGTFEFTRERALLAAIAISLHWHRPRVFWSRTIFMIVAAVIVGFVLVAAAAINGLPWLAYLVMCSLFLGVFFTHRHLISRRTEADMKERVSRFTNHFKISIHQLVEAGSRDGGDLKKAAQFLSRYF